MEIKPKGNRVLVEVEEKENYDDTTSTGFILPSQSKDSHDNALLSGVVLEMGTPELDQWGIKREPDVEIGTKVFFNRYNAFKVFAKGVKEYFLVACPDIWGVEKK